MVGEWQRFPCPTEDLGQCSSQHWVLNGSRTASHAHAGCPLVFTVRQVPVPSPTRGAIIQADWTGHASSSTRRST